MDDLQDRASPSVNDSGTCEKSGTPLTQRCSGDVPDTPGSLGAMAALNAKAKSQGITRFFDDPIHIRRTLIVKRSAIGADTPYGHTCSNIVEQMDNLFGYETPAWAEDVRQTLPHLINYQIQRLEVLR